jgi:hypothetical protein
MHDDAGRVSDPFSFLSDVLGRFGADLVGRVTGPMTFRLVLQPLMVTLLAVRAGVRDARQDIPPYLSGLMGNRAMRRGLLLDGLRDVGRVFVLAVVLDLIYQAVMLRWIYPGETLVVATLLAVLPYVLVRGPVRRLVRLFGRANQSVP